MSHLFWNINPSDFRNIIYNMIGAILFITCVSRNASIQKKAADYNYRNFNSENDRGGENLVQFIRPNNIPQQVSYKAINNFHTRVNDEMGTSASQQNSYNDYFINPVVASNNFRKSQEKNGSGKHQRSKQFE